MKTYTLFAATAAALLTASAAQAQPPVARGAAPGGGWTQAPADCPLTIGFTSYGAGIDGATLARVERLLNRDRGVRRVTRHPWGREGEVTLCARTRTRADAVRLARRVRALIPARPRGPINVELPGRPRH